MMEQQVIPDGYKQTEVGVIPEDWEVASIGDVANLKSGSSITSERIDNYSSYPCYGGNGLRGYTSTFTHNGNYALIGRQGALCGNVIEATGNFFASEHAIVVTPQKHINIHWLAIVLKDLNLNQYAESSAQPGLSAQKLQVLKFALPIKKEQTAIANALSDVDALITSIEKLIAKKLAIKTATMQQLLTGKKRLPPFDKHPDGTPKGTQQTELGEIPEDWDYKPLSELTSLMTNGFVGTAKTHYTDSGDGVTYIQGYNVKENAFNFRGIKKVTIEFHRRQSKSCLREGDVLMVQTGDVGLTTIIPKSLEGSNCHALIISRFKLKQFSPMFFSYYLNSNEGRSRLVELEVGTTMKHINVGDLQHFQVPVPCFLKEQISISKILTDMNVDIDSLKKRLFKTQQIKQGMMQELLTGKTRLV